MKETALHDAARKAHVDVARVLIQNGTDVNAVDDKECTALHEAARKGPVDVVKVLIQNSADVNAVDSSQTDTRYPNRRRRVPVLFVKFI